MKLTGLTGNAISLSFRINLKKLGFGNYFLTRKFSNGHCIIKSHSPVGMKFYTIYKKQFYFTFGRDYKMFCDSENYKDSLGESINLEALERAIKYDCDYVVFLHPEGAFALQPNIIKKFCESRNLIRRQERENSYFDINSPGVQQLKHEQTYSFPKSLLREIEEL